MENIYKIKIRTNPDTRSSYPSERRYSASTALGIGVVHLFLATTALLLAALSIMSPANTNDLSTTNTTDVNLTLDQALPENTTINTEQDTSSKYFGISVTIAPCLMSLGALSAGLSAILAWKRWYIDNNITWCFFMSLLSSVTSLICVIFTIVTIISIHELRRVKKPVYDFESKSPNIRFVLTINVLIASMLELLWSVLSTKFAYVGMNNEYPEDIVISRHRGKMVVSTVQKGSKKLRITPPDILNHFPDAKKLAKYFPSVRDHGSSLPNCESNAEYQERVRRFLSSNEPEEIQKST